VTGGRRVEDDVCELGGISAPGEELGELIERRDLDRAGARELFFHTAQGIVRQNIPVWADHPFPIGVRRCLRIDVQGEQARGCRDCCGARAERHPEHLVEV
jgi:hypothetical protein